MSRDANDSRSGGGQLNRLHHTLLRLAFMTLEPQPAEILLHHGKVNLSSLTGDRVHCQSWQVCVFPFEFLEFVNFLAPISNLVSVFNQPLAGVDLDAADVWQSGKKRGMRDHALARTLAARVLRGDLGPLARSCCIADAV